MTKIVSFFDTTLDSVVNTLHERYNCFIAPKIYTHFGSILVAINPIYLTNDEYSSIYGQSSLGNSDAHIYEVAKRTLDIIRPGSQETVVVIGDSGSGKTVTVGHALDFLTANSRSSISEVFYQKILSASHLMELFANAQTCLNTNSSRFGKLISLVYSCGIMPQLEGAEVEAFLLEKSRVTSTPVADGSGENFHILRLLVSKLEDSLLFEKVFSFKRSKLISGEFTFRVAPFCTTLTENCFSFDRARHLLSTFGCDEDTQMAIFQTLAVILHLCNLEFISRDETQGCEIAYHLPNVHTSLLSLQALLGISDCREIQQAFTTKPVTASSSRRQSVYRRSCGQDEAEGRRNSVARLLYSQVFEFIMKKICSSVSPASVNPNTARISVLDIFGFEKFSKSYNDFEQLCINFCNEKIQQHFARVCINDVRRELGSEGLTLDRGDFCYCDNDPVIALFESAPTGIFCMLDEKCRLNRTGLSPAARMPTLTKAKSVTSHHEQSSEDFFQTLCFNFRGSSNRNIRISLAGSCEFTIYHYAGPVVYSAANFVEKSRDDVSPDLISFFSLSAKNRFVTSLLNLKAGSGECGAIKVSDPLTPQAANDAIKVRKRSLPAKYRSSTASLIRFLTNSSNVHYVRCIRPNSKPATAERNVESRTFDQAHVAGQLASAGLVDVLRLANATGKFSRRFSYRAFVSGFHALFRAYTDEIEDHKHVEDKENNQPELTLSENKRSHVVACSDEFLEGQVRCLFNILKVPFAQENGQSSEDFFFGKSKLFLNDRLFVFFRRLQQVILRRAAYRLQRVVRKWLQRRRRLELDLIVKKAVDDVDSRVQLVVPDASDSGIVASPLLPGPVVEPFFINGDIVSRRNLLKNRNKCPFSSAWFHVRPNPVLHGAHVVNIDLFFQQPSLTDCL